MLVRNKKLAIEGFLFLLIIYLHGKNLQDLDGGGDGAIGVGGEGGGGGVAVGEGGGSVSVSVGEGGGSGVGGGDGGHGDGDGGRLDDLVADDGVGHGHLTVHVLGLGDGVWLLDHGHLGGGHVHLGQEGGAEEAGGGGGAGQQGRQNHLRERAPSAHDIIMVSALPDARLDSACPLRRPCQLSHCATFCPLSTISPLRTRYFINFCVCRFEFFAKNCLRQRELIKKKMSAFSVIPLK